MIIWPFGQKAHRKRAIKSYMSALPWMLRKKYGKRKHYTADQVVETASELQLDQRWLEYAIATFCTRKEFEQSKVESGVETNYLSLREEIADRYFRGETRFTIHNVLAQAGAPSRSWVASKFNVSDLVGGDGSGGFSHK